MKLRGDFASKLADLSDGTQIEFRVIEWLPNLPLSHFKSKRGQVNYRRRAWFPQRGKANPVSQACLARFTRYIIPSRGTRARSLKNRLRQLRLQILRCRLRPVHPTRPERIPRRTQQLPLLPQQPHQLYRPAGVEGADWRWKRQRRKTKWVEKNEWFKK